MDAAVCIIERAQPYDGHGWICYAPGDDRGTGYGETPDAAFADWQNPDSDFKYWTQGEGVDLRIAAAGCQT